MRIPVLILAAASAFTLACTHASTEGRAEPTEAGAKVTGYSFYPERRDPPAELQTSLHAPQGFAVDVFARDLKNVRMMAIADDGAVFVTRPDQGDVLRIVEGQAPTTVVKDMDGVHGIAFHD